MRIPSGSIDRFIYFVAVDATDLKTRETGLTGFTVYRSRDGGVAAAFTTPTVNETDSVNMPGVYELLLDEDTSLAAEHDTEEFVLHITQASMSPVTRVIELYRPETTEGRTLTVESDGMGHVDVKEWLGSVPSALVGGNVQGQVSAYGASVDFNTTQKASVNTEVDTALNTAVPGSPTANSINERIKTMDDNYTAARAPNLDNLDATVSSRAPETGGNVAAIKAETDKITLSNAGAGVAGSIIEEIENRATPTDVDTQVDSRLNTAVPVSPTADSMYERLKRLEEDITPTRAGNLDNLDATVSTRATPAQVNTEVVDALVTDTYPEPSGPPPATASLKDKIGWNTALARNKIAQTSTTQTLRNDTDTANIGTSAVSDDGTTANRDEWV